MTVRYRNYWPVDSTRFLLPTIAVQGFRCWELRVTFAWWTWRLEWRIGKGAV
jgi:hypothetical protein